MDSDQIMNILSSISENPEAMASAVKLAGSFMNAAGNAPAQSAPSPGGGGGGLEGIISALAGGGGEGIGKLLGSLGSLGAFGSAAGGQKDPVPASQNVYAPVAAAVEEIPATVPAVKTELHGGHPSRVDHERLLIALKPYLGAKRGEAIEMMVRILRVTDMLDR